MTRAIHLGISALLATASVVNAGLCGNDKTVHLKKPVDWTDVWYVSMGSFIRATLIDEGNSWVKFPLQTSGSYDDTQFQLARTSNGWLDSAIGLVSFNVSDVLSASGESIPCSSFGTGTDLYLMENPESPGRTYLSTQPPAAKYLHVLPPQGSDWFGTSLQLQAAGYSLSAAPDTALCGWINFVFFNKEPPTSALLVSTLSASTYGAKGLNSSQGLDIKSAFADAGSDTLYLNASGNTPSWTPTYPGDDGVCKQTLASRIFDTDASLHGAFSCDNYPYVATTACSYSGVTYLNASSIPCMGVTRGIVQRTLANDHTPVYNSASGCFENSDKFDQLFHETPGVNLLLSYDLHLTMSSKGYWTFDSYSSPQKGFFPVENVDDTGVGTKRPAQCGVAFSSTAAQTNPATGLPAYFDYAVADGDFADGDNPAIWDWSNRSCALTSDVVRSDDEAPRNQHFCMQVQSHFVYHPGQALYTSATNDLWIFINDKLTVDLGGMHLPAPGQIQLDALGLTDGNDYPFSLFLCDRRTTMSDFRLMTNIWFGEELQPASAVTVSPSVQYQSSNAALVWPSNGMILIPNALRSQSCKIYSMDGILLETTHRGQEQGLVRHLQGPVLILAR